MDLQYTYDAVGNVKVITDGVQTTNFAYALLDRLAGASGAYNASHIYHAIGGGICDQRGFIHELRQPP